MVHTNIPILFGTLPKNSCGLVHAVNITYMLYEFYVKIVAFMYLIPMTFEIFTEQ
jgi:hypothetical protein